MNCLSFSLSGLHKLALPLLVILLAACSPDVEDKNASTESPVITDTTSMEALRPATPALLDPAHYQGQALELVDIAEQQMEGAATLVLSFSIPVAEDQDFSDYIVVADEAAETRLESAWQRSADGKELHMRHLPPQRTLIVEVQAGLRAINGERLREMKSAHVETRSMQPMAGFASRGSLLPSSLANGLPVLSVNVDAVDVDFYRVREQAAPHFIAEFAGSSLSLWNNDSLQAMSTLVYSGRFELQTKANVQTRSLLPIREIAALQQPGIYYAVMRQAGHYQYTMPASLFSLSDIGLSVHRSQKSLDVFALDLASGKPMEGVRLEVLDAKGKRLLSASTDSHGHAGLPQNTDAQLLLGQQGSHTSFLPLDRSALDLSEFASLSGPAQQEMELFTFGPRDLYRPGEVIQLNALLRDSDGRPLPERPLRVEVLTPDGQVLRNFVWQPTEPGFYQYELALAESAPTGRWQFDIDLGGGNKTLHEVQVEDFMPERLALLLSGSEQPLGPADTLDIRVEGNFLYGAPAAATRVQGQLFIRPLRAAVASLPGYVFGSVTEQIPGQSLDFREQLTDAQGRARLQLASTWQETRSPLELLARVSLLESAGRPVTRRHAQAVWPAARLPGIRAHFTNGQVEEDSLAAFSVLLSDAAGELQAASGVKVRLVRERRDYFWSYSDHAGWTSSYSEKNFTVLQQEIDLDTRQAVDLEFPVQWGSYRLEVEDPATGLLSSERFWAGYRWQDSSDGGTRPDQVRLKLDKPAYTNGDVASIRIEAPHPGSGYLLVESAAGLHWWQNIDVPEQGLEVRIPVAADWQRHDLYVSALVVRPGERDAGSTAKRAVGVLHLPLDRSARQLQLEIEARDRARAEQALPIRVRVRDANGKIPEQARVLISAVDVGVLNITDYKTPDPLQGFFGRKAYAVDQLDVYGQLIDAADGALARLRFGGDAAMEQGGSRAKSHVRIVAWQSQTLQLDTDGYAEVSLPVPDFNGQIRLMAQAWTDDRFASAEQNIRVAAPLVAELALPRFLARGDDSQLALELHNLTEITQNLQLEFNTDNRLQLLDGIPEKLSLAAGERQLLPIRIHARATGTTVLDVGIQGLQLLDEDLPALRRNWKLDIRSPWPAQSRRLSHFLQAGESWSTPEGWLNDWLADGRSGRLTVSSQPVFDLAALVRELYEYPYGCSEQTASRLLPLLYLPATRLGELLGKPVSTAQRNQLLQNGIEHLLSMQRHNGSFAMWDADGDEIPWNTVLATDFLQQASLHGLDVPETRLHSARERLRRYIREGHLIHTPYSDAPEHSRLATQSYAAYILAQHQPVPLSALRALHAQAEDAKAPLALVHLAAALHKSGDGTRASELLERAGRLKRAKNFWIQDYGSPLSEAAWQFHVLQQSGLLPAARLQNDLAALVDGLQARRWLSTQENVALFMALHDVGLAGGNWQARLQTATKDLQLNPQLASVNLDTDDLREPVHLHNTGDTPLYQLISTRGQSAYYQSPTAEVLHIERAHFNIDGSPAQLQAIPSGKLLLVHLQVSASENVRDALVVDLLPAGLELENQNLGHGSVLLGEIASFRKWQDNMANAEIAMQAFLDDRYVAAVDVGPGRAVDLLYLVRAVTPGEYQLPPAQVQSMYRPDWQAEQQGREGVIKIR